MATAYCYDPLFLEHTLAGHPENRVRLERIMARLREDGLLNRMVPLPLKPANRDLLARIHRPGYVAEVEALARRGGGHLDADTYVGPASYEAAALAAGAATSLVDAILKGQVRNGIALVRPPGHHAEPGRGMGFCLFNNVAVAAQAALDRGQASRILIFDWDVHHGNGTQAAFYDRSDVLYFSTHQYPHYPGTGNSRETGRGAGAGYTVNVPLPPGMGDDAFAAVFDRLLEPIAERYQPDLILVSAGYDAHWVDPLASLYLSLAGYWRMARSVMALAERVCHGRLAVVLEGGYDLRALSFGVADTCRVLLGDPEPGPDPLGPCPWSERPILPEIAALRALHGLD